MATAIRTILTLCGEAEKTTDYNGDENPATIFNDTFNYYDWMGDNVGSVKSDNDHPGT